MSLWNGGLENGRRKIFTHTDAQDRLLYTTSVSPKDVLFEDVGDHLLLTIPSFRLRVRGSSIAPKKKFYSPCTQSITMTVILSTMLRRWSQTKKCLPPTIRHPTTEWCRQGFGGSPLPMFSVPQKLKLQQMNTGTINNDETAPTIAAQMNICHDEKSEATAIAAGTQAVEEGTIETFAFSSNA